ncbi:hypothetical protein RchiOBHm_Chr6g0266951 [Rosa chinensis]|uniref:Uncharacterized protein n=1 Tax=Rosa chinensis TaxID=74649 RepID=A0A2P6PPS8_ROSCH|nr:hypothetical protein RchiOBHm_Chr6g0266951 [Rosa chinensis]
MDGNYASSSLRRHTLTPPPDSLIQKPHFPFFFLYHAQIPFFLFSQQNTSKPPIIPILHFSLLLTKIQLTSPRFTHPHQDFFSSPRSTLPHQDSYFLTKIHLTKIPSSHQFHKIQRGSTSSIRGLITTWVKGRNYNSNACYVCFLAFVTCLGCSPSFIPFPLSFE